MIDLGVISRAVIEVIGEAKVISEDKKITVGELMGVVSTVSTAVIEAMGLEDKIVIDLEKK